MSECGSCSLLPAPCSLLITSLLPCVGAPQRRADPRHSGDPPALGARPYGARRAAGPMKPCGAHRCGGRPRYDGPGTYGGGSSVDPVSARPSTALWSRGVLAYWGGRPTRSQTARYTAGSAACPPDRPAAAPDGGS